MTHHDLNKGNSLIPNVDQIDGAIVVPCNKPNIGYTAEFGVFDANHNYVEDSGVTRKSGKVNSIPSQESIGAPEIDGREAFFAGYLVSHFGHFLLESLARLRLANKYDMPIVWASGQKLLDFQKDAFDLLGIDTNRFIILTKPTQFKRLHIPKAEYQIPLVMNDEHRDFLAKFVPSGVQRPKTYIARSKFNSFISNAVNENELVEALKTYGWDIIYPEELSLSDQLNLIANSDCVAGIEGSAFHLAILCADVKSRFIMLRRPLSNRNYDTIAKSKKLRQYDLQGFFEAHKSEELRGRNNIKFVDIKSAVNAINNCYINFH